MKTSFLSSPILFLRVHDVRRLHVDVAERAVLGAQDELGADDVRRQPLLHHPDVVVAAAAGNLLHLTRLHVPVPRIRLRLRPPLALLCLWSGTYSPVVEILIFCTKTSF